MQKRAWNGSTSEWINETHYTKDEVDGMVDEATIPYTVLPVTITYTDSTTQEVELYANVEQNTEEEEE